MKNPIQALSDAMITDEITRPVGDPFMFLKEHHRKLDGLFSMIEETGESALSTRERLFMQIRDELDLHTEIEEMLVYPKLKAMAETRDLTEEAYEEHMIVKNLLAEMGALSSDNEEWTAKMSVLIENVRHHVEEEESDLLPKAESLFSEGQQAALGKEVEAFLEERGIR